MGEARRKKLAGNTEPSNLYWKRTRNIPRKQKNDIMNDALQAIMIGSLVGMRGILLKTEGANEDGNDKKRNR